MNQVAGIIFFFASILILMTWFFSSMFTPDIEGVERISHDQIRYHGPIDQYRVAEFIDLYQRGDRLIITSTGGDLYAGMSLGDFINRNRISVEVDDYCISSCANYVFLAGAKKILNTDSLVIFHGGPKQGNFLDLLTGAYSKNAKPGMVYGVEGFEAIVSVNEIKRQMYIGMPKEIQCADNELLTIYGECRKFSVPQKHAQIVAMENQLYRSIDPTMDINIPYYGQLGQYASIYRQYKYFGFYYNIESLKMLGVKNIELKSGKWEPQRNRLFDEVYLVETFINN